MNWEQFDKGVYLVNVLGIVYNPATKQIVIGRRENDPNIKNLTWCFPGGRPGADEDLESYLKDGIKKKTGLDVEIKEVVFAKTYPENRQILSIYYLCEVNSSQAEAGESFKEVKWIAPAEVQKYFTTSIHPKILEILKNLD